LRNVGDAACAMSHAAQCTQRLAAGRGTDGYQVTNIQLTAATYTTAEHWTDCAWCGSS